MFIYIDYIVLGMIINVKYQLLSRDSNGMFQVFLNYPKISPITNLLNMADKIAEDLTIAPTEEIQKTETEKKEEKKEPGERISLRDMLKHPFFKDKLNNDNLEKDLIAPDGTKFPPYLLSKYTIDYYDKNILGNYLNESKQLNWENGQNIIPKEIKTIIIKLDNTKDQKTIEENKKNNINEYNNSKKNFLSFFVPSPEKKS